MKRFNLIVIWVSLLIIMSLFSKASIEITELQTKDKYYLGESLSGKLMLNIINESVDSTISINSNNPINIISLLKSAYLPYFCQPYDCSPKYTTSNPSLSKQITINGQEKSFGFKITGNKVKITGINLNISSNFGEEDKIPLRLDFFRRTNWVYKEPSTNYNQKLWGCYDTSIPESGLGIIPYEKFQISSNSYYCEKIYLPESGYVQTGAEIESISNIELLMRIFSAENPSIEIASCTYPSLTGFCNIKRDNWYQAGEFYFCLGLKNPSESSQEIINIFKENYESTCGWYVPQGYNLAQMIQTPSSIDYSLFARTGKYAPAKQMIINNLEIPNIIESANNYLNLTYKNSCPNGCVLPVFISGVNQTINLHNSLITYEIVTSSGGVTTTNQIYDLISQSAVFDFFGTLDLKFTNTTLNQKGNSSLLFYFNNLPILNTPISVFSEASINELYPLNPPAGLNTNFTINIKSETGISKIKWDFGDNTSLQTTTNNAQHIYNEIGNYNLKLELTDLNGVTISKEFKITVTSPKDFIKSDLEKKQIRLDNLTQSIASLPIWYQNKVKEKINFTYYETELRNLQILQATNADEQKLVEIFIQLQKLFVPSYVFISEQSQSPNIITIDDISPEVILSYAGGEIDERSMIDYKISILNWQEKNLKTDVKKTQISYFDGQDNIRPALGIYSVNLTPNISEDLYLIINQEITNLEFKTEEDPIRIENKVLLSFVGNKQLEFFDLKNENTKFFVSPKLSSLTVIENIQKCNFNGKCEPDLGETISGCRNDCKPTKLATIYFILLFIGLLVFYSFIAWWYKYHYESKLFSDKKQVYNLVMFILNSRQNGLSDWKIGELLRQQRVWNSEQISYCFKRANGKRIGFPEIIPIEKLKLIIRKIKIKANSINKPKPQIVKW